MVADKGRGKFTTNLSWKIVEIGTTSMGSFLILVILAKTLTPAQFGIYSLILSILALLMILGDFGIANSSAKFVAEHLAKDEAAIGPLVSSSIILAAVQAFAVFTLTVVFAGPVAGWFAQDLVFSQLLVVGSVAAIGKIVVGVMTQQFRGFSQFKKPAVVFLIFVPVEVALVVTSAALFGLAGVFYAQAAIYLVMSAAFGAVFYRFLRAGQFVRRVGDLILNVAMARKVYRYSLPLGISSFSYFLYTRIDIVLLGKLSTPLEIANYNLADTFFKLPIMLVSAFAIVLSPKITTTYYQRNAGKLQYLFESALTATLLVTLVFAVGYLLFSSIVIDGLFPNYSGATLLLRILAPILILKGAGIISGTGFMIATGNAHFLAIATAAGAILNVGFDLILIPPFGALGAVMVTVVIHSLAIILTVAYLMRLLKLRLKVSFGFLGDISGFLGQEQDR